MQKVTEIFILFSITHLMQNRYETAAVSIKRDIIEIAEMYMNVTFFSIFFVLEIYVFS